eukprot:GGOE01052956.1.p2 GENE.GGOE01052956.1~~GGOE01052956.1.p2  ORF type:complete len:254 (-),score=43.94 GGOE01052956.1:169-930(-)
MADPLGTRGAAGTAPASSAVHAVAQPDVALPSTAAEQEGQMQFLCDLCERLIGQMNVLTDRYEDEKQRNVVLQAEVDAHRNAVRHWRRRCQELEAQIEVDANVLQHANTSLALHKQDLECRLAAAEDDRKELLFAVEKRHRRELADIQGQYEQDLAILKSIRQNEALLQHGAHHSRPRRCHHSCCHAARGDSHSPPRLCQMSHAAQLACLPAHRTRSPETRQTSPPQHRGRDPSLSTSGNAHRCQSRRNKAGR